MKFGSREICEVVLKAKSKQVIGNKTFYPGEPVCYFDTLKTSSLESAATTVYATGGRGNARLMAWEGERTMTFTMEDALMSPEGFMILSGAGLINGSATATIKQHITETVDKANITDEDASATLKIKLSKKPYLPTGSMDCAYVMFMKNGEIISEPYIPIHEDVEAGGDDKFEITIKSETPASHSGDLNYLVADAEPSATSRVFPKEYDSVLVDYYTERTDSTAMQVDITPDKFGGNYYLEASTLFRDTNGVDMPAEFIIPNCKVQSNFTFTMASSGDPSTFTFTLDAFPDYTKFDKTKKVLATMQIFGEGSTVSEAHRLSTPDGLKAEAGYPAG